MRSESFDMYARSRKNTKVDYKNYGVPASIRSDKYLAFCPEILTGD